jgi:bile acid-coenzyme A ligase
MTQQKEVSRARPQEPVMIIGAASVMSIDQRCRSIAAAGPDRPAIIGFDKRGSEDTVSWRELDRGSAARAALLGGQGQDPAGAVIAFDAPSCAETVFRILACLRAGIPFLPLDPRAPPDERARLLRAAAVGRQVWLWDGQTSPAAQAGPPAGQAGSRARPARYLLASGSSSGRPRLIAHHGLAGYDSRRLPNPLLRATGWQGGQRQLIVGPLHHAAPLTICVEALLDGNTILLQETFSPRAAMRILDDYAVEWMALTPTHMQWMLMAVEGADPVLRSLRAIVHTAARCPGAVKRGWIDLVGPSRVFEFYAATEDIGTTLVRGDEWLRRPGTVGRGFCTQIRILDERGYELPVGSAGEVYLRRSGFAAAGAASAGAARRTADGFCTVGDHGWLDEERYLFLSPRREDMVVVGGANVYPAEVENVLADHPEIADSAVVGMPDDLVGARLIAFVVPRPAASLDAPTVLAFCAQRLSSHKVPSSVRFVDHVPRSEAGKLQRWRLQDMAVAMATGGEERCT